jgi:hypothetical protein
MLKEWTEKFEATQRTIKELEREVDAKVRCACAQQCMSACLCLRMHV